VAAESVAVNRPGEDLVARVAPVDLCGVRVDCKDEAVVLRGVGVEVRGACLDPLHAALDSSERGVDS